MIYRSLYSVLLIVGLSACGEKPQDVVLAPCASEQTAGISALEAAGTPEAGSAVSQISNGTTQEALANVVREVSWQLCHARESGWIDDQFYRSELTAMRQSAFSILSGSKDEAGSAAMHNDKSS